MEEQPVINRNAVRAIMLTAEHEVLLMRLAPPDNPKGWWICPGGGREPEESIESGLRRELCEELGLTEFEIGPLIWLRRHTFTFGGKRYCQNERFYVVHVDRFDPVITDETEAKVLDRFHWWPLTELAATDEIIAPLSLAKIVEAYVDGVVVSEAALAVEVLVD